MIKNILEIAKMLLAILPFVILCIASEKTNLSKSDRSRQFLMPILALVYVIVAMLLMDKLNDWLIKFINKLPQWISSLSDLSWMPQAIGSVFVTVGSWLKNLIASLNLSFWIFFISNTVILFVYLFVKEICMGLIKAFIKPEGALHTKVAEYFYEFFKEKNIWCIKESYVQVRSLFKVFYYGSCVLSSILMIVSRYLFFEGLIKSVFYPVFGVIVVGELYFYLSGATRREYSEDILGEDENAYKIVNYSLLRKFLRTLFGDKLLTENTSINNELLNPVTTDEVLSELEKNEDPKVISFAAYFTALHKAGFRIDHNYLNSSLDMLNGKSVLFNNPFYNDLIPYAFYPMNRTLLSHRKVLVVLGRHSIEDDIKEWIEKGVEAITNIPFMWNVGVLTEDKQDLDIGIVTRSDVLNMELHEANTEFLENVGMFVIIEPSKLISTAQIGLNLLVKKCNAEEDKNIVYCMCDKNCDGLVDAMSHVLMTSFTEVSATKKHNGTSSYMCWEADEDYLHHRLLPNISRYLGMGTELSFAALKNQVSKTKWYGGEAFPVTDMRWIDKQYYYDLTKYASMPTSQEVMDERFITSPNFWSAEVDENNYLTVEDESNNMFEILRDFSTRTTEQGFINVISSEYLLKDYMADNASIFEADAKAIPYIVADYARSNRNTILRLVLMMSTFPVSSEILEKELSLLGITVFDLKKQIWYEIYSCYSKCSKTSALPSDYREAVEKAYDEKLEWEYDEKRKTISWKNNIIKVEDSFNLKRGKMETVYSIDDSEFKKLCVSMLRSAGYIAEDEKGERYYLGAELGGHIYQKYLPGQFFTFGGKYYEMQYLTADGQVLVRRAADHINGRPSYRQIREFVINGIKPSSKIGSSQNVAGMKVVKEFADITVNTPGYYRMDKYNNFAGAKLIEFDGTGIPQREYLNKEILRIELPEADGKLNDKIRYTVTVLFNEVFRTIFAENQAYICAVTDTSFMSEKDGKAFTYTINGDGCKLNKNAIYIIEDSQLDLGLTVAVERNLERIFNVISDYLDWHTETLENSINPPPEPQSPIEFVDADEPTTKAGKLKKKIKGFFGAIGRGIKKLVDKIKSIFKKKPEGEQPEGAENTPEKKKPSFIEWLKGLFKRKKKGEEEPAQEGTAQPEPSEEEPAPTDNAEDDGMPPAEGIDEDESSDDLGPVPEGEIEYVVEEDKTKKPVATGNLVERKPYHERYYLLYGGEKEPDCLDIAGTLDYLSGMGNNRNPLKQARDGKKIAEIIEATFIPGKADTRYCDFCGKEILGVEYETLADGRDRCLDCGKTAIKTGEEFRKIFEDVKRNMEAFYGIRIDVGIRVEMVNARTLNKRCKKAFIPTPKSDGRVLGVAIRDKNGYTLMVENGSPRMASIMTMAHELTHIWQYVNWDDRAILKKYGRALNLEIYEGMAKWAEIQYAYLLNEPAVAKREEIITSFRKDEYGRGFLRYKANYPLTMGTVITGKTPFMDKDTPLSLDYCGQIADSEPDGR